MKKEELEAIKRRAEKATPGPWRISAVKKEYLQHIINVGPGHYLINGDDGPTHVFQLDKNDADFIIRAREDVPALVAEVERLRGLILNLLSVIDELQPTIGDVYAEEDDQLYDLVAEIRGALEEGKNGK